MAKESRAQREEARRRLEEERARQAAAQRRRTLLASVVGVVAIVLVLGAVVWGVSGQDDDKADAARPASVAAPGAGIPLAGTPKEGAPTVDVYTDFLCPACRQFEAVSGETLVELAEEGAARVVYHPVELIGQNFDVDGSRRIGGASGCADDVGAFVAFRDVAYANQPPEDQDVETDLIVSFARQAGVAGDDLDAFTRCVEEDRYADWVTQEWSRARDRNVTGTPTVFVDGRELRRNPNEYTPEGLRAAVADATKQD